MDTRILIQAAAAGSIDQLRQALDAGEDPQAELLSGRTALHLAVSSGRSDIAGALLFARADVEAKDGFGRSAIELERKISGAEHG